MINNDAPVRRSVVSEEDIMSTVSSKKLLDVDATKTNNVEGCRIIDVSILCNIMGLFSCIESAATVTIFSRSIQYGLRYTKFYSVGDSSSFPSLPSKTFIHRRKLQSTSV